MENAFLTPDHLRLAAEAWSFARDSVAPMAADEEEDDVDGLARRFISRMAEAGLLRHCVPAAWGGASELVDVRMLCVIREALAYASGLCDAMFALQGLGAGPISFFGDEAQRQAWLPKVAEGKAIAAFALTEPNAGSDPSMLQTEARRDNGGYQLNGVKRFISNAGIASFYVVFARTGEEAGKPRLSAFIVPADNPGLRVRERLELIAPHPIGEIGLEGCRLPASALIGAEGQGLRIALATLDAFRPTVGAAALGLARRALDETLDRVATRRQFGGPLAEQEGVQFMLADMATELDAARLLVYRAAWRRDGGQARTTLESAMAKLYATEAAQRIVDCAVQLHGGDGVVRGLEVERLYREVRALRIYEGASEIQKVVIARELLRGHHKPETRAED
ncbi:MAG: acyl-CoA dehydrogenase family protein [Deltaproteobacteria bacterium]